MSALQYSWPEPESAAVCLQEFSPDHHFVVEPLPEAPAITALVGFSGHGFKFASALGEAAADFATQGGTDLPVGHLSAARFAAPSHGRTRCSRTSRRRPTYRSHQNECVPGAAACGLGARLGASARSSPIRCAAVREHSADGGVATGRAARTTPTSSSSP